MKDLYTPREFKKIMADGRAAEEETFLLNEHELSIIVNEHLLMKLVCTNQNLDELVLGRLMTSGIIDRAEDVDRIIFSKYKNEAAVFLNIDKEFDKRGLKKLPKMKYENKWIFELAERFKQDTEIHEITSCTHSCMLWMNGEVVFSCEDIGRHNAIDKAVGYALIKRIPLSECIVYTSGRVPVDMAEKVIAAGIPVLASKSVPTYDAVNLAHDYGLVIIGNARPDSLKVF